ncbi:MAG: VOC family protein [Reyranella sp.]|uniref:VOC family protein n=1 Tax=Reyranella sp. TaxID=1929291 RepID=UPI00273074EC|nr:VOC family protein [Reyranella sp.]MDP1961663.1 VOC family protein [Reyranella sp.]MDP2377384.1 VOC family protein [Reyranella sp.]
MYIQPYLSFEGRTQEAIDFYMGAVGASVNVVMLFKDAPPDVQAQISPGMGEKVMHACIKIGESDVFMSDGQCGGKASFSGVTLTINASSDGEADKLFAGLGKGGQVTMPMAETFFASRFGMVDDKFGVHWMVLNPKK